MVLIRGRRLFEGGAYLKIGRRLTEASFDSHHLTLTAFYLNGLAVKYNLFELKNIGFDAKKFVRQSVLELQFSIIIFLI